MNSEKIQILVEGMEKKTKQKLIFIEMLEYFEKLIWYVESVSHFQGFLKLLAIIFQVKIVLTILYL